MKKKTTNKQTNKKTKGQDKQKEKKNGGKLERSFFLEEAMHIIWQTTEKKYTRTYGNTNTC